MQATNAAIESANQVAKDLAIRSAKAADRKRLSQKNNEQKPLKEQHVSNFSTVADTAKRLKNARRKVLAMTASSAGGGAGASGPPRLIISHLEARDLLARDIRKDMTATSDPVAFLFCGGEEKKTGVMWKTCNPIWKKPFYSYEDNEWKETNDIIFGSGSNILESKTLHIQVKDDDNEDGKVGGKQLYDNLGGVTIDLSEMLKNNVLRKKLQWYDLEVMSGMTKVQGQIRFSLRYTGKVFMDKKNKKNDKNKENNKNKITERPKGVIMKKRANKTKAMADFQAHRIAEAEKRELEALEKAKAEMEKMKQLEVEKQQLLERLEKAQAEKNIMEAQVHIMKEEQANLFLSAPLPSQQQRNYSNGNILNPEDTIHLNIDDDAINASNNRKTQADLNNLEKQLTRSIARLRDGHTRQNGMAEIRAIAESLLENDMPIVLKCLRSASNVHEGAFQRECVKVLGMIARTCPSVVAPYLEESVDAICSRITVQHEVVHNSCIESIGSLARRVLPILTRGRVKPSFSPILDPLLELVNKHGNSIIGEVAAKCLKGAFSINIPKRDMVTFKIVGVPIDQRDIEVARRVFRTKLPNIPLPKTMSIRADGIMILEVPTEMGSSYYQKLLDANDNMPSGWCLAANADATAAAVAAQTVKLTSKAGKNGSVPDNNSSEDANNLSRDGHLMRQHVILMGGCGKEIFRRILDTLKNAENETLSALLDSMCVIIDGACYGESRRIRRLSNAVAFAAPNIMQNCVDTLLAPNKSYIWRARRSALLLLGKIARLHAVSMNSGQITRNVQIIDGEVDIVIILKAIKDCTTDRINVVRQIAAQAMEEFQNANVIPPAFLNRFGKKFVPEKPKIRRAGAPSNNNKKKTNSILKSSSSNNNRKGNDPLTGDERPLSREVHRREKKREFPTRYKSRAPKGYTGIDKATLPPPPPVDHKPSNASCLKQLDRRQKNSLKRAADACVKRPNMILTVLRNVDKRGNFASVIPHLILCDELQNFDEQKITSMLHVVGPDATQRILQTVAITLAKCVNDVFNESNNMATHVLLKWAMSMLNTCMWSVNEIIYDKVPAWRGIKQSMRMLGGTTSNFDGAAKAATLYALLSTKDLLDSHLYIFGDEGGSDGDDSD